MWDPATGAPKASWTAHPDTVAALAYRPDGDVLASVSLGTSENVRLWDAKTHQLIATLQGHTDKVRAVAFRPDGRVLATAGSDRMIRIWDGTTGKALGVLKGHRDKVRSLAFWSGRLVSVSTDATAIVWNVKEGRQERSLALPGPGVGLAVAADGATLATSDERGTITLWDTRTWQSRTIPGEGNEVRGLAFSPDGRTLAGAGMDHKVHLWHPEAGIEMLTLEGHQGQVNGVAFAPDGRLLVSAGHDG